jgi:hypothetical protein
MSKTPIWLLHPRANRLLQDANQHHLLKNNDTHVAESATRAENNPVLNVAHLSRSIRALPHTHDSMSSVQPETESCVQPETELNVQNDEHEPD